MLVLGLGAVGTAVAYQLDRRGVSFIALERQPGAPHAFGSSHGETRITREAVGEGVDYIPLVQRSHAILAELETVERPLRRRCGMLYLADGTSGGRRHGSSDFIAATRKAADVAGVELERLTAPALRRAYPQFEVDDDTIGYLEPEAGFLRPERCIEAQLAAISDPSSLRFGETVLGLKAAGRGVEVVTDQAAYRARKVVVATGAWTPRLVGEPFQRCVRVLRQTLHWFRHDPTGPWAGGDGPAFIWFHGSGARDVFYGFPPLVDGVGGVKLATEQYEVAVDPKEADWSVASSESEAVFEAHARGRLSGVTNERLAAKACLYTYNDRPGREGRFLIGPHREIPGVLVVSACSGHGFKHAAGLGDAIVRQLRGEPAFCDLSVFSPTD